MAELLKGKAVSDALSAELLAGSEELKKKGVTPTLAIMRVGEKPDDIAYERGALKRAEKTGVAVKQYVLPEGTGESEVLGAIDEINRDDSVHGALLLRPMPGDISDENVRNALAPEKDVDGITDISQAGVYSGSGKGYPPCTAEACIAILKHYGTELRGKRAVVIGRSLIIGNPVALMLRKENATVTVCHTKTVNMPFVARGAEILIAAAGQAGMVTKEFMHPDQIVIDVGINVGDDGKLCGDVNAEDADSGCAMYTPVPGGVGAVTTSMLMKHVIQAAEKKLG